MVEMLFWTEALQGFPHGDDDMKTRRAVGDFSLVTSTLLGTDRSS